MAKILIVDDQEMNRALLSRILEMHGYQYVFATDGKQAIEVAAQEKPAVILMDMGLPVIDGWEATRQLRQKQETKDIPIIALTAHVMKNDKEKALEVGCNEYMSKPIDFDKLIQTIKNLLA